MNQSEAYAGETRPRLDPDGSETGGRRGRPAGDREAKRKELLVAGIKVIAELGYAGASLRKVAKQAGYTTGAVTYYFENKDALVMGIVEHLFDEFDELLEVGDEVADIKTRYRRWLALNADSDVWLAGFQLLAQARHEPRLAAIYQDRYARYRERTAAMLAKQQAAGVIRSDIPADLLADHLGSIGDGWMMMLPIEPERFAPDRIEALLNSIIALLTVRPPSATIEAS